MRALNAAGAGKIYLLPEPIAAAIGADLPIHTSAGNMIVNVGGGTAEVAVLSMNGLVAYQSLRGAGDAITQSIIDYLRKEHNLLVGEQMGERVKMTIGAVVAPKDRLTTEVKGRDSKTGMPASIEISADELIPAVVGPIKQIIGAIQKVLEQTPPELAADIIDRGIAISGGTALLYGIDQYFTQALNVPVFVVDEPLLCVTRGLSTVLEDVEAFKRSFRN
jgi:rod shape-determining protein MreB